MFRIIACLSAGLALAGCANLEKMAAEGRAIQKAQIEAAKIPEVQLTPAQLAALTVTREGARVAWVRAGIQKEDGKTFACVVLASGQNTFWTKESIGVHNRHL